MFPKKILHIINKFKDFNSHSIYYKKIIDNTIHELKLPILNIQIKDICNHIDNRIFEK